MSLILRGITSIKLGTPTAGNGMSASLAALGKTYKGTAKISFPEASITEKYNEEDDDPFLTLKKANAKTFEWEIYDFDNANMVLLFGGTAVAGPPKGWTSPAAQPDVFQSVEITDKNGATIKIPYADIVASMDATFDSEDVARIKIKATVLAPDSDPSITITEAAA